jgi:phosphorylase/glycogen(starch) synthase
MISEKIIRPDYVFEVSWEVCNKVGGIYTVVSTKAQTMVDGLGDNFIMIGPDIWKGPGDHPEFTEDKGLLASWRADVESNGFRIKVGRWKIAGNPIVVLVDFAPFFTQKDAILTELWTRYKVDSLTGRWDYIEPALFGYAAGKVIESFYSFHLTLSDKIIAQFHEWITGVGLLYLNEHVSQIATVFTTHATVVGRALAGSGLPFYSRFDTFNADTEARNYNDIAKHSLEKVSAANADCFTTVSEITGKECSRFLGKKPDIITPNGFDDCIVPNPVIFRKKRITARKKLLQVANALAGQDLAEDSLLAITSGRYEFHDKGVDVFIDALGVLGKTISLKKQLVAFIFIPANHGGPCLDLLERIKKTANTEMKNEVLTHSLKGSECDPILGFINKNQLNNLKENKVKVVFAPVYLDGNDGIFNLTYYDLLTGFDISAFPSYYEPWGYTPLESLAFHIPTITTNLSGFGQVVRSGIIDINHGLAVIERNDNNYSEAVKNVADIMLEYSSNSAKLVNTARKAASLLSCSALWKNLIQEYKIAYSLALGKAAKRSNALDIQGIGVKRSAENLLQSPGQKELEQTES